MVVCAGFSVTKLRTVGYPRSLFLTYLGVSSIDAAVAMNWLELCFVEGGGWLK